MEIAHLAADAIFFFPQSQAAFLLLTGLFVINSDYGVGLSWPIAGMCARSQESVISNAAFS